MIYVDLNHSGLGNNLGEDPLTQSLVWPDHSLLPSHLTDLFAAMGSKAKRQNCVRQTIWGSQKQWEMRQ